MIATQNKAIKINNIKAKIDKTLQDSECRLNGDKEETDNHVISNALNKHPRNKREDMTE